MRVAVAASLPAGADPGPLAAEAKRAGASLLVLPEALAGTVPELSDGPTAHRLVRTAREHGLGVLGGYVETCITGTYNAAMLVDGGGVCIANYRQAHVRQADVARTQAGHWLSIMPLDGIRVGLLLGYDIEFPEAARGLVLAGCDLLAVAGGTSDDDPRLLLRARARENRCWLAYAGPAACLIDPDGAVRAEAVDGGLAVGEMTPPLPGPVQPAFAADRQPLLYKALLHTVEEDTRPD